MQELSGVCSAGKMHAKRYRENALDRRKSWGHGNFSRPDENAGEFENYRKAEGAVRTSLRDHETQSRVWLLSPSWAWKSEERVRLQQFHLQSQEDSVLMWHAEASSGFKWVKQSKGRESNQPTPHQWWGTREYMEARLRVRTGSLTFRRSFKTVSSVFCKPEIREASPRCRNENISPNSI